VTAGTRVQDHAMAWHPGHGSMVASRAEDG
jgi:hypothetical protein